MKRIVRYFFQGLLVFVPAGLTILVVAYVVTSLDRLFGSLLKVKEIPGLGLGIGLAGTLVIIICDL